MDSRVGDIRRASRVLVRELGLLKPTLAATSLSASGVHALIEIRAAGSLSAQALADRLLLEKSSVSRLVAKLTAAGLLQSQDDASDARIKPLTLTSAGVACLAEIDRFADDQVRNALCHLKPTHISSVADGLSAYADALRAARLGSNLSNTAWAIEAGYRPGLVGECIALQAQHYAVASGFGVAFEAKIAGNMADFIGRLDSPKSQLWHARTPDRLLGCIAIDGEDLGENCAHLRWFIVDEAARGTGLGRALLARALDFCARHGFGQVVLWTFEGLDDARRLYEQNGFVLVEEQPGTQWGAEVVEQKFVLALH